MSDQEAIIDVVELCALLQCLGFHVRSLDTSDTNLSQDGAASRTVVVNCQASGLNVVLETPAVSCSCPPHDQQNSGFWQVSGVAGGKWLGQESGSTLLHALPKHGRERISKQLFDVIRSIRALNDTEDGFKISALNKSSSMVELVDKSASLVDLINKSGSLAELSKEANKSSSVLELGTPEKRHIVLQAQTPTRYRSLDTLTGVKDEKQLKAFCEGNELKKSMCRRQGTYTVNSTPASISSSVSRRRNKTSSPIQTPTNNLLESLIDAEKMAESLRSKLSAVITYVEDGKHDSSIPSMLDVSKISVLKGVPDLKYQFASSPNLSGLATVREDTKSKLKRYDSASTSNLAKPKSENLGSKLRRLSPNLFKTKKDVSEDGAGKSKLQSLFKPKIVTPVRPTQSPNLNNSAKKKFSHVKSTIPRLTPLAKK